MIKHVVSWEFAQDNKAANLKRMQALLEELPGLIPEIVDYEVGLNIKDSELAMDMVLISAFADETALQGYANHPEHKRVVEALHSVTSRAVIVDYKI
ncbi:MAG: Dabb family protein [FCB group bacterium]|nr:Dabb family protein [FCB group bacterium]MBL7026918.1 Dabb family protein [Candidatus Neomarinimicrobiota bacterium]MBL7120465.1 Dabb family protein [Candidatus Neomarinimicrobiota bacterium]